MSAPESRDGDSASERLDRFYDRLRRRMAEPLAGKVGEPLADTLLLAPDLFVLLVRLFTDRGVPAGSRSLVGGALAYFLLPADLLPEVLLGAGGYLDDVVLAAALVSHVFSSELRPFVERHWSGRGNVHGVARGRRPRRRGAAAVPSLPAPGRAARRATASILSRSGRSGACRHLDHRRRDL